MDIERIDEEISNTDISGAMTGGCVSFAVALDIVFDVDKFCCAFDPWDDSKPLHAVAVKDGVAIDAKGTHSTIDITEYVSDWWSGLRIKDFQTAITKIQSEENCSETEAFEQFLLKEGLETFNNRDLLYNIGASETQVQTYVNALQDT